VFHKKSIILQNNFSVFLSECVLNTCIKTKPYFWAAFPKVGRQPLTNSFADQKIFK